MCNAPDLFHFEQNPSYHHPIHGRGTESEGSIWSGFHQSLLKLSASLRFCSSLTALKRWSKSVSGVWLVSQFKWLEHLSWLIISWFAFYCSTDTLLPCNITVSSNNAAVFLHHFQERTHIHENIHTNTQSCSCALKKGEMFKLNAFDWGLNTCMNSSHIV